MIHTWVADIVPYIYIHKALGRTIQTTMERTILTPSTSDSPPLEHRQRTDLSSPLPISLNKLSASPP
jgi:hypothetical protein